MTNSTPVPSPPPLQPPSPQLARAGLILALALGYLSPQTCALVKAVNTATPQANICA